MMLYAFNIDERALALRLIAPLTSALAAAGLSSAPGVTLLGLSTSSRELHAPRKRVPTPTTSVRFNRRATPRTLVLPVFRIGVVSGLVADADREPVTAWQREAERIDGLHEVLVDAGRTARAEVCHFRIDALVLRPQEEIAAGRRQREIASADSVRHASWRHPCDAQLAEAQEVAVRHFVQPLIRGERGQIIDPHLRRVEALLRRGGGIHQRRPRLCEQLRVRAA